MIILTTYADELKQIFFSPITHEFCHPVKSLLIK